MSRNPLTPVLAVFYLIVIGIAVAWSLLFNDFQFHFIRGETTGEWIRQALLGAGAGVLVVIVTTLATEAFGWARDLEREFREILGPFDFDEIVFLALASGIAEEILFRGVIQESWGLVPTSLVFGLLHVGPNARYLPWTLYAIGAGFLLGVLYERGGLVPVILTHVIVNFISLMRINRRRNEEMFLS